MSWYALYTTPRAEKRTNQALIEKGIETYLPLQKTLKQWSDRKKWVEEPLFKSYLFVNIYEYQHFDVLNTQGVVRFISFEGKAVSVPPQQIEAVRYFLSSEAEIPDDLERYTVGSTVEVIKGPMKGLMGELVSHAGRHKVRVEVDAVGQSLYLTLPMAQLRILK